MKSVASILKTLKSKTEKVLHLQEALQKDNNQLKLKLSKLQSRVDELETLNKKLDEQNKIIRIAQNVSGPKDSSRSDNDKNLAIKLKINELVREIDKCIAQLNR
jgi:predicted nuclease with TOPRIM domain